MTKGSKDLCATITPPDNAPVKLALAAGRAKRKFGSVLVLLMLCDLCGILCVLCVEISPRRTQRSAKGFKLGHDPKST